MPRSPVRTHPFTLLDVFCERPLEGNGLAVVHDADDLDEATMLRFAREMRLSETTFVQAATEDGADYRNRIWMMSGEIPFAGHPSLGTAVAVARRRGLSQATLVQQTVAGRQPVDVRIGGDGATASMLQEPARFGPVLEPAPVLAAVGLEVGDGEAGVAPQVVGTGVAQVVVPLADPAALGRVRPDWAALAELLGGHDAVTLYLAAPLPVPGRFRARSFTASALVGEDPATGSAVGPLCALLAARGGPAHIEVEQGVEMGRPSRLLASLEDDRVRVSGGVVPLVDGTLRL